MDIEVEAQDEALDKVHHRLNRLATMHRENHGKKNSRTQETPQEQLFRADGIFESNQSVIDTLHDLANAYPEVTDVLKTVLVNAGLVDNNGHS